MSSSTSTIPLPKTREAGYEWGEGERKRNGVDGDGCREWSLLALEGEFCDRRVAISFLKTLDASGSRGFAEACVSRVVKIGRAVGSGIPAASVRLPSGKGVPSGALDGGCDVVVEMARRRAGVSAFTKCLESEGVPAPIAAAFAAVCAKVSVDHLDTALHDARPSLPRVIKTRWRLDVTISSSHAARVMRPSVLLELSLDSGAIHTLSVPIDKFHELRYGVARALRDSIDAQNHAALRLAADMDRRAKHIQARDK